MAAGVGVFVGNLAKDLPDYEVLAKYEPPVTTRVHASDGALMGEFARERRLYLPIQAVPDRVKAAFLSAEDKNFYHHPGVDVMGLFRAAVNNLQTGSRQGASTITQQVAKNFLLAKDQTYERKIKEAILSFRIEQAYPQGPHPRTLPQRDLLRPRRLWHRRRGADLLRQIGQRADRR